MMESVWWIPVIDWRISSGVIFFIQLVVWDRREKRSPFSLRILSSFVVLCGTSWCMRYVLEEVLEAKLAVALGYSVYILTLSLLFMVCYRLCYHASLDAGIFNSLIALTVYRFSWNAVKLISAIPVEEDATWISGSPFQSVMSYLLYLTLSIIFCRIYRYFVRRPASMPVRPLIGLYIVILLCQMLLEFTYQLLYDRNRAQTGVLFILTALLYCLVIFVLCVMGAFMSLLHEENLSMQNFIRSKQQYYEISREGILSLQVKCHDLKHQIGLIRAAEGQSQLEKYMNSLSDTIDEYNTVVNSGNKGIDVVLTEKNIICSMNGIRFTYIIDGTLFSFLTDMEIYALFGNSMDNALESMENVTCGEKKFISLKAARRGNMVVLVVENYYEHKLKFENGMPITTKEEKMYHGFGMRSIMNIAQEHGGGISVQAANNIFTLTVSMQCKKGEELTA